MLRQTASLVVFDGLRLRRRFVQLSSKNHRKASLLHVAMTRLLVRFLLTHVMVRLTAVWAEARASDFIQCCADYLAKRFKPALATCERLLEQWPDWHDVLVLYAIVLRRGRKWQRAKQLLDQAALTTSSPFAVVLRQFNRGLVNGQLGQWEDALADFTSACRAAPLQSPAWFQLGVAHKNLGDARSSTIAYQRAIHLNPSASTYWPEIGSAKS